jgi:hypothetical protein
MSPHHTAEVSEHEDQHRHEAIVAEYPLAAPHTQLAHPAIRTYLELTPVHSIASKVKPCRYRE